jgi:hypothetical protein
MHRDGSDQRIAESNPNVSFRNRNHLIWADTLCRPTEEELKIDDDEDTHSKPSSARTAGDSAKKHINREYTLQQQHAILNEVVFGNHKNTKGIKISPFRRNDHGNLGHFFKSVTAALNFQANGPFEKARAVQETVRTFVETAIEGRKHFLLEKYGDQFMTRRDWDVYDQIQDSDEDDGPSSGSGKKVNTALKCGIDENLDALVYNAFSATESIANSSSSNSKKEHTYTDSDDERQAGTANGNEKGVKKQRINVEKVRPPPQNPVLQLSLQQNSLQAMVQSITSLVSAPMLPAAVFQSPSTPAAVVPHFDEELVPLLDSLKNLPEPPGTTAVCKNLASSLGNYGISSVQELRKMAPSEAEKILTELKWSPLQIQKVLNPKAS